MAAGAVTGQLPGGQGLDIILTAAVARFNGCGPIAPGAKLSPSLLPVPVRVQSVQSECVDAGGQPPDPSRARADHFQFIQPSEVSVPAASSNTR